MICLLFGITIPYPNHTQVMTTPSDTQRTFTRSLFNLHTEVTGRKIPILVLLLLFNVFQHLRRCLIHPGLLPEILVRPTARPIGRRLYLYLPKGSTIVHSFDAAGLKRMV